MEPVETAIFKELAENKTMPNADILHTNGVYISNNHFVGDFELNLLKDALAKALKLVKILGIRKVLSIL